MNDTYMTYAKTLFELANMKSEVSKLERLIGDLKDKISSDDETGSCALDMSSHASKQILERFESLASENSHIYDDVWKPTNIRASLMSPTNMKSFIISIIANARKNGDYTEEDSKNTNGKEYHYKVEIKKWSTDNKKLVFTGIVENFVIKTGYFNWV